MMEPVTTRFTTKVGGNVDTQHVTFDGGWPTTFCGLGIGHTTDRPHNMRQDTCLVCTTRLARMQRVARLKAASKRYAHFS